MSKLTDIEAAMRGMEGNQLGLNGADARQDDALAHVATGEFVLPPERLSLRTLEALRADLGDALEEFTVGGRRVKRNPLSGFEAFYNGSPSDAAASAGAEAGSASDSAAAGASADAAAASEGGGGSSEGGSSAGGFETSGPGVGAFSPDDSPVSTSGESVEGFAQGEQAAAGLFGETPGVTIEELAAAQTEIADFQDSFMGKLAGIFGFDKQLDPRDASKTQTTFTLNPLSTLIGTVNPALGIMAAKLGLDSKLGTSAKIGLGGVPAFGATDTVAADASADNVSTGEDSGGKVVVTSGKGSGFAQFPEAAFRDPITTFMDTLFTRGGTASFVPLSSAHARQAEFVKSRGKV